MKTNHEQPSVHFIELVNLLKEWPCDEYDTQIFQELVVEIMVAAPPVLKAELHAVFEKPFDINLQKPISYFNSKVTLNNKDHRLLLELHPDWLEIYDLVMCGMKSPEIGNKLDRDDSGVRYIIRRLRKCGVLPPDPKKAALELERKLIALTKKEESDIH